MPDSSPIRSSLYAARRSASRPERSSAASSSVAADRLAVDRHERHRPPAAEVVHALTEGRVVVERHFVVGESAGVEQHLGADAVAAPFRRIEANPRHRPINACKPLSIPTRVADGHGRSGHGHSYTGVHGSIDHDRGRRPPLLPARRGRPHPARVHARAGTRRRGREGRPQDEVTIRRAPGAVLPRRARPAPGPRRARHRDGRVARALARPHPLRAVSPPGRE